MCGEPGSISAPRCSSRHSCPTTKARGFAIRCSSTTTRSTRCATRSEAFRSDRMERCRRPPGPASESTSNRAGSRRMSSTSGRSTRELCDALLQMRRRRDALRITTNCFESTHPTSKEILVKLKLQQLFFVVFSLGLSLASAVTQAQEPTLIRVAYVQAPDHPHGLGIQRFAELVQQKSGGKISVKTFGNATLGGDTAVTSALRGGTID